MSMRTLILAVVALGLLGGLVDAQPYPAGWFVPGKGHLHYVSPLGKVTSVTWPGMDPEHAMMHWDNRTVLVADLSQSTILKVDPVMLTVVGTLTTNGFGHIRAYQSAAMDSNGDIFFGQSWPQKGIFKLDHNTFKMSTIFNAAGSFLTWPNQFLTDVDTGEIIVGDDDSSNDDFLYLVRRDASGMTSIGKMGGGWGFTMGCYKHIPTGDIYSGEYWGSLNVLKAGTSVATLFQNYSNTFGRVAAPHPDRASAATQTLVTGAPYSAGKWDGLWSIDIATKVATKIAAIPRDCHRCLPVYGRNVQSVSTGKGTWDTYISFPGQANKAFLMAISATGVRPGLPLPDGRQIPLVLDTLALVSITPGLAPFVTGNTGHLLDQNGEGMVKINLGMLPQAANGVRLWFCALVLDSLAPLGIAEIADPKCFVIEGL
jgi:hypothetical protein